MVMSSHTNHNLILGYGPTLFHEYLVDFYSTGYFVPMSNLLGLNMAIKSGFLPQGRYPMKSLMPLQKYICMNKSHLAAPMRHR